MRICDSDLNEKRHESFVFYDARKVLQKHALFDKVSEDIQDRGIYPNGFLSNQRTRS